MDCLTLPQVRFTALKTHRVLCELLRIFLKKPINFLKRQRTLKVLRLRQMTS